jgi:hypothetical protein
LRDACVGGSVDCIKLLIGRGARIDFKDAVRVGSELGDQRRTNAIVDLCFVVLGDSLLSLRCFSLLCLR